MASKSAPSLLPEIGLDGIARESPVIAYTEKVIEEEQLQLKRYIQENYSKIRDVERELENLTLEMKLTAGPKRAALEHMRKKIELANERLRVAKSKEEQAKKAWEEAVEVVKKEELIKQNLCDDLNHLVQESASTQYSRLEELKRRLEALNPSRVSCDVSEGKHLQQAHSNASAPQSAISHAEDSIEASLSGNIHSASEKTDEDQFVQVREKKRVIIPSRGKKNIIPRSKAALDSGWTGAGFDVDERT
ncbi:hypothetical protein HPP92_001726 [Vanilla planifolia]|uniref:RAB6-interacting golgin n=1 Tax=Vanilla planifolia TaxID=51239 RepID=A0A835VHB6_VANPL|nr:hypothetical protein HPP92_001726 [Vanilla planifolia]